MKPTTLFLALLLVMISEVPSVVSSPQQEEAVPVCGIKIPTGDRNMFLAAMDTMMINMANAPGDESAGIIFLQKMIPHHECAMAMAMYEVQHGRDFSMIQLAKSILIEQASEVQQMRLWQKQKSTDISKSTVGFQRDMDTAMNHMMATMPGSDKLRNTDYAFASVMKPHHQAAVDMARAVLNVTKDRCIRAFASQLITSQQIEIEQMVSYLK
ncbi:DUF305 domain-containing protein [Spirosoma spitsbergense]|uniref:DUF305 domain-containing protein n=1 Tax=Spirosoma spitsbergense TaxID=431554 RepID=UPI000A03DF46|nr:DUF305 domain-containing protein [Spirosoma spitsbergense]